MVLIAVGIAIFSVSALTRAVAQQQARNGRGAAVAIDSDDIGGVVTSSEGPEAGVWVIAETSELPTKFVRIVVTDDQGRYVIPDLPKANYRVWVRGYGLVDSRPVQAAPGKVVNLTATVAPNERAAATYYPANYWLSLLQVPSQSEFPIRNLKNQGEWIDAMKLGSTLLWQLGDKATREFPESLRRFPPTEAWKRWEESGESPVRLGRLGERGITMMVDWISRINAGEYPKEAPPRPQGVERNIVITEWDWSDAKGFVHDNIATDKRNPTVNANGLIYGLEQFSADVLLIVDPIRHTASRVKVPLGDPNQPVNYPQPAKLTWGDEPVRQGRASLHNPMLDHKGRVWITGQIRMGSNQPDFCKQGSSHPSAMRFPIAKNWTPGDEYGRNLILYDPATRQFTLVDTCYATHHLQFAEDSDHTLFTSGGVGVLGWFNTKVFDETGDAAKAQRWIPYIIDTNGNGKVDEYVDRGQGGPAFSISDAVGTTGGAGEGEREGGQAQSGQPPMRASRAFGSFVDESGVKSGQAMDPTKDMRVGGTGYGIIVNTVDGSVWQAVLGAPGYLIRTDPKTGLSEIYEPPFNNPKSPATGFSPKGVDVDRSTGVIWTTLSSSGHLASFDRRTCKVLNGPTATGQHCPEGWTLHKVPGPSLGNADASSDYLYYNWVDQFDAFGLGKNVPIASGTNSDSLLALSPDREKFVVLRVPYPLGFYTRGVDGRIDDPKAGWKGKGLWTTYASVIPWHVEGGKGATSKVVKFQLRPDPLAK